MKPDRVFRILPSRSSPAVILPRGSTGPAMRLLPRPGRGGRSRVVIIVRPLARGNHEPDRWLTAPPPRVSFGAGPRDGPPDDGDPRRRIIAASPVARVNHGLASSLGAAAPRDGPAG